MEFPELGQHCAFKSCHRLEYCPFKCHLCSGLYCTKHRVARDHNCAHWDEKETGRHTVSCPICQAVLVPLPSQDINDLVLAHINDGCGETLKKDRESRRCSQQNCKTIAKRPITCDKCSQKYCVTHRLSFNHDCRPIQASTGSLVKSAC